MFFYTIYIFKGSSKNMPVENSPDLSHVKLIKEYLNNNRLKDAYDLVVKRKLTEFDVKNFELLKTAKTVFEVGLGFFNFCRKKCVFPSGNSFCRTFKRVFQQKSMTFI